MLLFSLRDIDRVVFTLGRFHSNKNAERIKDSGFWAIMSSGCRDGREGSQCSVRPTECFPRKGKWCHWHQGGAGEGHNDRKSERNRSHLDSLGSGVGVGRAPFPLTPVCFIGCDNVVVLGRACVHMHFLVCYGNMGFLFFYLCSLWSFGSWLSELRTLNSPTRSHCPHNHLLSRGIR